MHRASCVFERPQAAEEVSCFTRKGLQTLLGPWRKERRDAEADLSALQEAYEQNGLEAAFARKNELRRTCNAETPSERNVVVPTGELGQEQMDERYGPGLAMMKKMGYSVGDTLGTSG